MKEICSCTAQLEITDMAKWNTTALLGLFKEWRETHRHEFAPVEPMPEEPEIPTVVESGSSHERALPFGFTREMDGDLS